MRRGMWRGSWRAPCRALVVLAAGLLGGCARPRVEPAADAGRATEAPHGNEVTVDPSHTHDGRIALGQAQRRPLRGDLRVPGEVVSSESGAAEVSSLCQGRIAALEVREGDAVKRGQVLAWVDSREAAQVLADAIRARARAEGATRKVERQEALVRERATSAAALDEARVELTIARADAAAARTMLAALGLWEPPGGGEAALPARVPLRSPIDGVVTERLVALGAPVAPDKVLFRVVASDRVVVDALWGDPSSPPPAVGTQAELRPRGGDGPTSCAGKVLAALTVVDGRTRARRVRVAPSGPCAFLLPGAFVDVALAAAPAHEDPTRAPLVVDRAAVIEVHGGPVVFVAGGTKPGAFVARSVRLGRATAADVAIEDGLAEGEHVAVVGAVLLKGELLRAELESP